MVDNWMEYLEELAISNEDTERIEALHMELSDLIEHPIELNRATEEQLKRLPFLSDLQIDQLLNYRQRYGAMLSLYELKYIESLDRQTLSWLLPFVYIEDKPVEKRLFIVKNLLKYGNNKLFIRVDRCLQDKSGYKPKSDSILEKYPNRSYLGEPFYHSIRYTYEFDDRLFVGCVAEKDAGEPFWKEHHKGYDYYSAHLFLRDMNWLKTLALGDYKVSFGQGLVVSNDFTPSRTAQVTQVERRTHGFRRHFSTNEQDFFRGVATTWRWRQWELSAFYSFRRLDAGVDSMAGTFTSFKRDGIHRLPRDWEKRKQVAIHAGGGHLRYILPRFQLGITTLVYSFGSWVMKPEEKPYNLFDFNGSNNINMGVDYEWKLGCLKLFGETAISKNGAYATLNALQLTPASYLSLLVLHRHYDRRYHSLYGNAFSQGASVQNEQGVYVGLQATPVAGWRWLLYADWFRFPWLRYGVDAPSQGKEYMAQWEYTFHARCTTSLRYKYRKKEKNGSVKTDPLVSIVPYTRQQLRWSWSYGLGTDWRGKSEWEGIRYAEAGMSSSKGWMLAQSMAWTPASLPFRLDGYIGWFQTSDYNSRVYSFEKNILYAFQIPSFYGKGVRWTLSLQLDLCKQLSLSAKWAHTHYLDRDFIGTDTEEIAGSNKSDLYALLRWKF